MTMRREILLLILPTLILAGCAQSPSKLAATNDVWIITLPAQNVTTNTTAPDADSFAPSTLYSLLLAELAGHQGLTEVTLHHYLQQAIRTEDLGIIKRTVEIADLLNDSEGLLQATLLWTTVEPDNTRPFSIASEELIQQGRFEEALPVIRKILELGGLDGRYVIHDLIRHGNAMTPGERERYLALFDDLLQTTPDNTRYLYAKASLLAHDGRYEEALHVGQRAVNSEPKYTPSVILVADLQDQLGHLHVAVKQLEEHLVEIDRRKYRNHKEFRLLYTRLLMKSNRYAEAEAQAEIVALKNRHDENILYYLGALMLNYERLESSQRYFSLLPDLTGITGELRYYLGRIARLRGNPQEALDYFVSVDDPQYLLSSFIEIGDILSSAEDQSKLSAIFADVRDKHPYYAPLLYGIESYWLVQQEQNNNALPLLNEALSHYPDDARLLFNRAVLWGKLDNRHNMEIDLHKLLNAQSHKATTSHPPRYTLTDPVQRYIDMEGFVGQAAKTKPDNPVILDGMGWMLHNSGDLEGALNYLKKAYDIFPDPDIAAHLGTVYWKMGQHQLAKEVWGQSLKEHPNYDLLNKLTAITGDNF